MFIKLWQESNKDSKLNSEGVQIWSAFFDQENYLSYFPLLSEDEKIRADRLKNPRSASQQIISRGILRLLLGNYTGKDPKDLVFSYSKFGKPVLTNTERSDIFFNLSHSGNLLLIAIGKGKHIGIDVEKIDGKIDIFGISSLVFSNDERYSLSRSLDPVQNFYELWTAKEAILKSTGLGFSYPSNQFSVVITKGNESKLGISKKLVAGSDFSLASFTPVTGYSAAMAVMH
jgi:4'-phosphopantetheinyl transferase